MGINKVCCVISGGTIVTFLASGTAFMIAVACRAALGGAIVATGVTATIGAASTAFAGYREISKRDKERNLVAEIIELEDGSRTAHTVKVVPEGDGEAKEEEKKPRQSWREWVMSISCPHCCGK